MNAGNAANGYQNTIPPLAVGYIAGSKMAKPTNKTDEVEALLDEFIQGSRRETIRADVCIPRPIGCGQPALEFTDALSHKEYRISGLCQVCQDVIFGA